ncbi:MAG: hypothetical protein ACO3VG_04995 [Nitriliruptoraceae bacterium]
MLTVQRSLSRPADGSVVVRVDASRPGWEVALPPVPGTRVAVTVGAADLADARGELAARGYDLVGVVPAVRGGRHADVLVPAALRADEPRWFAALLLPAARVFDLRFGPVGSVLRAELELLLPAHEVLP